MRPIRLAAADIVEGRRLRRSQDCRGLDLLFVEFPDERRSAFLARNGVGATEARAIRASRQTPSPFSVRETATPTIATSIALRGPNLR